MRRRQPHTEAAARSEREVNPDLASTAAEAALEYLLNSLGKGALAGEFKRQWPVGDWVVDFYFPEIRLAIEVDGGYHRAPSRWRKDLHKTRDLDARGITVLRLTNAEVAGDRERLIARLRVAWRAARQRVTQPAYCVREAAPTPYLGGGAPFPPASCADASYSPKLPVSRTPGQRPSCVAQRCRRARGGVLAAAWRASDLGMACGKVWPHS